jgi:hypothetical protein
MIQNMTCRSCNSKEITPILDLGQHPWCNDFLKEEELGSEKIYPLELVHCDNCELLQLNYTVPKETMFKNHTYVSSTTKTLKSHFRELALENKIQFSLDSDDLILDIGGNDGTQMLQYMDIGLTNVLNVESADNISEISRESGVNTINDFFNESLIDNHQLESKVKLVNASGVFFHLEELHSVIKGIKKCLKSDGVFVVQFMYAGTMIDKLNFDGIYHEHLCYYTLRSINNLMTPYGFRLFDSYYSEIHSGSIIAKFCFNDSPHTETERCKQTRLKDKEYDKQSFMDFATKVESKKTELKDLLISLKETDSETKIYAYGAPAKGNTLLNYFGIDSKLIDKCVEVNDLKIGLFLPKSHIPIIRESQEDLPNYYLLLAHNFAEEIIQKNKNLFDRGVKFIIPFPEATII